MPKTDDIILTANRLEDGVVLWMTGKLDWTANRSRAAIFDADNAQSAHARAEQDAAANRIVSVYAVAVNGKADQSAREMIRAAKGPSIIPPADKPACASISLDRYFHPVMRRTSDVSLRSA
ncbi:DUF2849 domain-containing protein [uncultured Candidatus Puniceispirillum sp.]|uniref:DUF2849 domain-containing protein n=1 Tax=uncultured Candidatus Puniceispirillum sp. TaxID=1985115 RepID=UPI002A734EA5|nr:DUF2849 domain-containing protein [Candidatus Puniceispirillum sp.]